MSESVKNSVRASDTHLASLRELAERDLQATTALGGRMLEKFKQSYLYIETLVSETVEDKRKEEYSAGVDRVCSILKIGRPTIPAYVKCGWLLTKEPLLDSIPPNQLQKMAKMVQFDAANYVWSIDANHLQASRDYAGTKMGKDEFSAFQAEYFPGPARARGNKSKTSLPDVSALAANLDVDSAFELIGQILVKSEKPQEVIAETIIQSAETHHPALMDAVADKLDYLKLGENCQVEDGKQFVRGLARSIKHDPDAYAVFVEVMKVAASLKKSADSVREVAAA